MITDPVMIERSKSWPRSPRGKMICPDCGGAGWPGGSWLNRHRSHAFAPCGKKTSGLGQHIARCARCKEVINAT